MTRHALDRRDCTPASPNNTSQLRNRVYARRYGHGTISLRTSCYVLLTIFVCISGLCCASTSPQPFLFVDINPGPASSNPSSLCAYNGTLYFVANNGSANSTLAITVLSGTSVYNFGPVGTVWTSPPSSLTTVGSLIYFTVGTALFGVELWSTGGTPASTVLAADINPGVNSSSPAGLVAIGNSVYFACDGGDGDGIELWAFNGSVAFKAASIAPGVRSSSPSSITYFNGFIVYSAYNATYGTELYFTDPSKPQPNVALLYDVYPGPASSSPSFLCNAGSGYLFFSATTPAVGTSLWYYDGGTITNIDVSGSGVSTYPSHMTVFSSSVYFTALGLHTGYGIYSVSIGNSYYSIEGAPIDDVMDEVYGFTLFNPYALAPFGSQLYIGGYDHYHYSALFTVTPGYTPTLLLAINPNGNSTPIGFTIAGSNMYFSANESVHGNELWALIPTPSASVTPSFSSTASFTASLSPTKSFTASDTVTVTTSPTYTSTRSLTVTVTPTHSLTASDSVTVTLSTTYTPTRSVTTTATSTPTVTRTVTSTHSLTASDTVTATSTVTITLTRSLTATVTSTATVTKSLTPTHSLTASDTVTVTVSQTVTSTRSVTSSVSSTETPTGTYSPTRTTSTTATVTLSSTLSPSGTVTSSNSVTPSITPSRSLTSTVSPTRSPSGSPSVTSSVGSSGSASTSPSASPSVTGSSSPTRSLTPSNSASSSISLSSTRTVSVSPTVSVTSIPSTTRSSSSSFSPSLTPSVSPSVSVIGSATNTATASRTPTPSVTISGSPSNTITATSSNSPSRTPTVSLTPSTTPTAPASYSPSPTPSFSSTVSLTGTQSVTTTVTTTLTPSPSLTISVSSSISPTLTSTVTHSPTVTPTLSATVSVTTSVTSSVSMSPSPLSTPTPTHSISMSVTPSVTVSITMSMTPSPSVSADPLSFSLVTLGSMESSNALTASCDLDGDGLNDVFTLNGSAITVWLGPSFTASFHVPVSFVGTAISLLCEDWNGDGWGDAVLITTQSISVMNTVDAVSVSFHEVFPNFVLSAATSLPGSSGSVSVLAVSSDRQSVLTLDVSPTVGLSICVIYSSSLAISHAIAVDTSRVIVISSDSTGIMWLQALGDGLFVSRAFTAGCGNITGATAVPSLMPSGVDVILVGSGGICALRCATDGSLFVNQSVTLYGWTSEPLLAVSSQDMNEDGLMDIVALTASNDMLWFQSSGEYSFIARDLPSIRQYTPLLFQLVDVDSNGVWDILPTSSSASTVEAFWLQNLLQLSLTSTVWPVTSGLQSNLTVVVSEVSGVPTLTCAGSCAYADSVSVSSSFSNVGGGAYTFVYPLTGVGVPLLEWAWRPLPCNASLTTLTGHILSITSSLIPGVPWHSVASYPLRRALSGNSILSTFVSYGAVTGPGAVDFALVSSDGSAGVWFGTGTGAFTDVTGSFPGFSSLGPVSCAVWLDANGDGYLDLLVFGPALALYVNSGGGVFSSPPLLSALPSGTRVSSAAPTDVNGDGAVDVVFASDAGLGILLSNHSGSFTFTAIASVSGSCGLSLCDVNGDGLIDIWVFGCNTDFLLKLLLQSPALVFTDVSSLALSGLPVSSYGGTSSGVCAELTGDGALDVFLAGPSRNYLLVNNGTGYFTDIAASAGVIDAGLSTARMNCSVDAADVDLSGASDVFVCCPSTTNRLFVNNGNGFFTDRASDWQLTVGAGVAAFADVDGDGDADLYTSGLLNPRVVTGVTNSLLRVSVYDRRGRVTEMGTVIRLVPSGGSGVVTALVGGAPSQSQPPSMALVGVFNGSIPYDISVSFPGGIVMTSALVPSLAHVIPSTLPGGMLNISLIPFITQGSAVPASGVLGIGARLSLSLHAAGAESGLTPMPNACSVGGVNVSSSFAVVWPGVYSFTLLVQANVLVLPAGSLTLSLMLMDSTGTSTPAVTQSLIDVGMISIDSVAPIVTLCGGPAAGQSIKAVNSTVCVVCSDVGSGCASVWYNISSGVSGGMLTPNSTGYSLIATGPSVNGEVITVTAWATDVAGNVGAAVSLYWTVDLNFPVSTWLGMPSQYLTSSTLDALFTVSKPNCVVIYSLDGGSLYTITPSNSSSNNVGSTSSLAVDTVIVGTPALYSSQPAMFMFAVSYNGTVTAPDFVTTFVRVSVDGSPFVDIRTLIGYQSLNGSILLSNLAPGSHSVEAQAVLFTSNGTFTDFTPTGYVWIVTPVSGPSVTFLYGPSVNNSVNTSSVTLYWTSDVECELYQWSFDALSWTNVIVPMLTLTSVAPGIQYTVWVRGIGKDGVTGSAAVYAWTTSVCPTQTASVTGTVSLWNDSPVLTWTSVDPSVTCINVDINNAGQYTASGSPAPLLPLAAGMEHIIVLSSFRSSSCANSTVITFTLSYTPSARSPGVPSFSSLPSSNITSVFASFSLSSSYLPPLFLCSLDGAALSPCAQSFQLGPLSAGTHTLSVVSVGLDGTISNQTAEYSWTILPSSASAVEMTGLRDGLHNLSISAVDDAGNVEPPHIFMWTVATKPPVLNASLATPALTNVAVTNVTLLCVPEYDTVLGACEICWALAWTSESMCDWADNVTGVLNVSVPNLSDGVHVLSVWAIDGAGNTNTGNVTVSWAVDRVPPITHLLLSSGDAVYVPAWGENATTNPLVTAIVSGNKPLQGFFITVSGVALGSMYTGSTANLSLPEGTSEVVAFGVDVAGNVDPIGSNASVYVDGTPPTTLWVDVPPLISNATAVTGVVTAVNTRLQGIAGFRIRVVPLSNLTAEVTSFEYTGGNASAILTVGNLFDSDTYSISVYSVDVVGLNDPIGAQALVIVDHIPPTSEFVSPPVYFNSTTVRLRVQGMDTQSSVVVFAELDGSGVWTAASSGTVTLFNVTDGAHVIGIRGVDAAGNVEPPPFTSTQVIVDTVAPVLQLISQTGSYWASTPLFVVCVGVLDALPVTLNAQLANSDGNLDGSVSISPDMCVSGLMASQGYHVLSISATDSAGNTAIHPIFVPRVYSNQAPGHAGSIIGCASSASDGVSLVCGPSNDLRLELACSVDEGFWTRNEPLNVAQYTIPCSVEWLLSYIGNATLDSCALAKLTSSLDTVAADWTQSDNFTWTAASWEGVDGQYVLFTRAVDAAGNTGPVHTLVWWWLTMPPPAPTDVTVVDSFQAILDTQTAHIAVTCQDCSSPGGLNLWYAVLVNGQPHGQLQSAQGLDPVTFRSELTLADLLLDAVYVISVWTQNQAGIFSGSPTNTTLRLVANSPPVSIVSSPPAFTDSDLGSFTLSAAWPVDSPLSVTPVDGLLFTIILDSQITTVLHATSDLGCNVTSNVAWCVFIAHTPAPGEHTLQVRTALDAGSSSFVGVLWTFVVCQPGLQYLSVDGNGVSQCLPCITGMNCSNPQQPLVAPGYWASPPSFVAGRFYPCPLYGSCLGGMNASGQYPLLLSEGNGTAADVTPIRCSTGYVGLLCTACGDGFFMQFGRCNRCPSSIGGSIGVVFAAIVAIVLLTAVVYRYRASLPTAPFKVGVSAFQILAACDAAYNIPWPPAFAGLLGPLKLFLVDVIGLIPVSCAHPVNYYTSVVIELILFKVGVGLIVAFPLLSTLPKQLSVCARKWRQRLARVRAAVPALPFRSPPSSSSSFTDPFSSPGLRASRAQTFRSLFLYLFLCYPGVTLKMLRMFRCVNVEGVPYIAVDVRLQCYDAMWAGMAVYVSTMLLLFTVGLPLLISCILLKHRQKLFGPESDGVRATWGFLYESYGVRAWGWEVEEMVRKLILACLSVLLSPESPLPVALAVLVCMWSHVLHALFQPWGRGSPVYALQHLALTTTTFVYVIGLLFKAHSISVHTRTGLAMSVLMLALVSVFAAVWIHQMVRTTSIKLKLSLQQSVVIVDSLDARVVDAAVDKRSSSGLVIVNPMKQMGTTAAASRQIPGVIVPPPRNMMLYRNPTVRARARQDRVKLVAARSKHVTKL